ncbi:MAG: TIGR04086 family membrane protein [Anaerovoracaceae bacterium]|nr:TIGR04086 family membrane protein [Bacillota bacterium]MDD7733899.1 TIGR04086 family membrane protein [Bacillota bacterium]MDY5905730.1 TIGR04086 family membrane protein [Anaerovoracaceae bacterium]
MKKNKNTSEKIKRNINAGRTAAAGVRKGLKGFTAAVAAAAAGVLISGLMLFFTAMGIDSSTGIIIAFITVGAFINGYTAAAAVGRKGLITGIAAGVIYVGALTVFFALTAGTGAPSAGRAALLAIPVAASGAAGVLGVGKH